MQVRHSKVWSVLALCAAIGAVALLVPLPYPPSQADRSAAVSQALDSMLKNKPLPTPVGMAVLGDASFVQRAKGRIYFVNQVDVPDSIFVAHGLRPIPKGVQPNVSQGDVVVSFSFKDRDGSSSWFMHLGCVYGNLGGDGYEIRIFKSPGLTRFEYVPTWIS